MKQKEPINKDAKKQIIRFTCFWTKEVHALIKMHSSMGYQTMNEWVLKAVLEKLGEENKFIK